MVDEVKGLSNEAREILLNTKRGKAALVLDACYAANLDRDHVYKVKDLIEIFNQTSERLVREGCKDKLFRPHSGLPNGGRPPLQILLPYPNEVDRRLVVVARRDRRDPLPNSAFANLRSYRAAIHKAMVDRLAKDNDGAFRLGRAAMSSRLGVSSKTVRSYEKLTGVLVQQIVNSKQLKLSEDWGLPSIKASNHRWLQAVLPCGSIESYPAVQAIAAKLLKDGCTVHLMTQCTNAYGVDPSLFYKHSLVSGTHTKGIQQ